MEPELNRNLSLLKILLALRTQSQVNVNQIMPNAKTKSKNVIRLICMYLHNNISCF
jgi:hypothetical protein